MVGMKAIWAVYQGGVLRCRVWWGPTTPKAGQVCPPSPQLLHICITHCIHLPPSQICCLAPQIWYAAHICIKAAPSSAIPVCGAHIHTRAGICANNSAWGIATPWLTHFCRSPSSHFRDNPESFVLFLPWTHWSQVCQRVGFRSSTAISTGSPGR